MSKKHLLLFPHERATLDTFHDLNVRAKSGRRLQGFLDAAGHVAASIGPFEDIHDLAEQHAGGARDNIVTELVLLVTGQIGQLLVLAEESPSILSQHNRAAPLAFGAGLLAAGVLLTATTIEQVTALGLDAISIAFHLGLALQQRAKNIEESKDSWARVVSNAIDVTVLEQLLEGFNAERGPMSSVYIGQILPDSTVVYGPPYALNAFDQVPELVGAATPSETVFNQVPLHGAHLPPVSIESILDTVSCSDPRTRKIYEDAVNEIAHRRLDVPQTVAALAAELQTTDITLIPLGPCNELSGVTHTLKEAGLAVELGSLSPSPKLYADLSSTPEDAIAVVGMSGRFPQSDSLSEFWQLLESARATHQIIPESRFNVNDFYDPTGEKHNAMLTKYGCFLKNPGVFDHRLFNISPKEAMQMDPVQRMLLMVTYEALEMAGYSGSGSDQDHKPRIANYFGQTVDDWKSITEQQGISTHYLPGINRSFAPGRLSHYFGWSGGFHSIDTGCSSSATGICLARDALVNGDCEAAVVGGGTLLAAPEWFAGLSQGGFLSPTGGCKTFSKDADGYCRGEGLGVVVLKRLSDAVRARDNVLAVVSGVSRNCNAGAGSITYPGEKAQAALYRRVLRESAVRPGDVQVVEMHGTGTQAGDKVEMNAVKSVFVPGTTSERREEPLIVGAVKASIGHSEAAAGVISMIKAILILQNEKVPAQPDQPIDLNPHLVPIIGHQIQIANGQSWKRDGAEPRYIFVNNFDAAGGNVSMLLREAPDFAMPSASQPDRRTHHVIVTSGRTATAHEANRKRLVQYLAKYPETNLADLAYTTTARRMHNVHRDAYVATSTQDLVRQLQKPLPNVEVGSSAVVFGFTGQGAQSVGMGGTLYSTSATFRRIVDSLQDLCTAQGLKTNFINAIREDSGEHSPTEADMQVATVTLEIALARYWQFLGIHPTVLIGHSIGEYAALCIAGVLSASDTLMLAHKRASLIFSRCVPDEAGMLAVSLPRETVAQRIGDSECEVCCVNGPSSTVVGGPVAAIEALEASFKSENASVTRLRVKHAFHTRQMDIVLDELEASAAKVSFRAPSIPIASTVLGRVVNPGEKVFNAEYIAQHTRQPVLFNDAVRECQSAGLIPDRSFAVEIGPHPVCIGLLKACLGSRTLNAWPSLRRGGQDWEGISACLAAAHKSGLPASWDKFHRDHLDSVKLISDLPTYAFDLKTFWHSYKSPVISAPSIATSPSLGYTTLHSVDDISKKDGKVSARFNVDVSDEKLATAIKGHVVDDSAICPASIFIDMAYTAAAYLEGQNVTDSSLTTYAMESLQMHSPLVLRDDMDVSPTVWVEASLDVKVNTVSVSFKGRKTPDAPSVVDYGSAIIHLSQTDTSVRRDWSRMQPLIQARVQTLQASASSRREVHTLSNALFYKLFSEIVDYSRPYHAVQDAIIAPDFRDAAVTLKIADATASLGTFKTNPFAVDALVHVAGFLLNANIHKPKSEIHIANHTGSLRILGDLSAGAYNVYATVREQDVKGGTSFCDVYATNSQGELVAVVSDICFKKLDRDFFALLTGATRKASPVPAARNVPKPRQQKLPAASPSSSSSSSGSSTPASGSESPASSVSATPSLTGELLEAVEKEIGVTVTEMKASPGTTFTEFGVDSQMAISILSAFQTTTGVELPAAFFTAFPTLAEVERELGVSTKDIPTSDLLERSIPSPSHEVSTSPSGLDLGDHLLSLVREALGLDDSDLTPSTTFDSVGMDSMLSIKIAADFQVDTGEELPAAFFSQNPTVKAALENLNGADEDEQPVTVPAKEAPRKSIKALPTPTTSHADLVSRAILIQGSSRSTAPPLFLTTDGSGTVESYIHLQPLPKGRRIYALESPFLSNPTAYNLSIEEMASMFLGTILRIQPTTQNNPYLLGGWSAGSMYAYEIARQLAEQGCAIAALVILDMRAPSRINTSLVTTDFVSRLGTFEGIRRARNLPGDLTDAETGHLMATCRALSKYEALPFPSTNKPKAVLVMWAKRGLDDENPNGLVAAMRRPGVELGKRMDEMSETEFQRYFQSWFYGKRLDFGMNGWEELTGREGLVVEVVDGDHFSMMCPPFVKDVGRIVVETVNRAVGE